MKLIRYLVTPLAFSLLVGAATAQTGPTPEQAPKIAEIAVTMVQQVDGYQLDYSPESLKAVDRILLNLHNQGVSPQSIQKTVISLGCYVGEVMVRNLGYKWDLPSETERAVGFSMIGVRDKKGGFSNPIGKVYKRVQNGQEDSVVFFYAVFSKSIVDSVEGASSAK